VPPTNSAAQASASRAEADEGRAGKARSSDLDMRGVNEMHAQPAVATPAPSVWKPVSPTSSAAQASASRAEVAEGRAGKARSPDLAIRKTNEMHAQPAVAATAPSVGKPVTPTSSAAQASAIRAEAVENEPESEVSGLRRPAYLPGPNLQVRIARFAGACLFLLLIVPCPLS